MSLTEEADYHDKGINEVLQQTDDLTLCTEVNKTSIENGSGEKEQKDHANDLAANGSKRVVENKEPAPDIDLADPDRVLQMLETVDLSEEDTEFLLQEAYKMNRKLKDMLKHQESSNQQPGSQSCPPDIQRQKIKLKKDKGASASPSHAGPRAESGTFSANKPLPPISSSDIYAIKLRRSKTNIPITNSRPTVIAERSKSSKGPSRNDSRTGQTRKKPKVPEEKPEWNSRFNYT